MPQARRPTPELRNEGSSVCVKGASLSKRDAARGRLFDSDRLIDRRGPLLRLEHLSCADAIPFIIEIVLHECCAEHVTQTVTSRVWCTLHVSYALTKDAMKETIRYRCTQSIPVAYVILLASMIE